MNARTVESSANLAFVRTADKNKEYQDGQTLLFGILFWNSLPTLKKVFYLLPNNFFFFRERLFVTNGKVRRFDIISHLDMY